MPWLAVAVVAGLLFDMAYCNPQPPTPAARRADHARRRALGIAQALALAPCNTCTTLSKYAISYLVKKWRRYFPAS